MGSHCNSLGSPPRGRIPCQVHHQPEMRENHVFPRDFKVFGLMLPFLRCTFSPPLRKDTVYNVFSTFPVTCKRRCRFTRNQPTRASTVHVIWHAERSGRTPDVQWISGFFCSAPPQPHDGRTAAMGRFAHCARCCERWFTSW